MKLDRELYEKVSKITGTEYKVDYPKEHYDDFGEANVIIRDDYQIESMLEDLILEIHRLEERIDDIIEDRKENYRRIDVASQYNINENDFH